MTPTRWLVPAVALPGLLSAAVGICVLVVRHAARERIFTEDAVPPAPVALVLGALVYPTGRPSRFLAGRLDVARRLYEAGRVHAVLVSGDSLAPEWDEPAAMRRYLIEHGVPAAAVVMDRAGFDTYDSCVRARSVFAVDRVVVVSQAYHLPRAVGTARMVGLEAVGVGDRTVEWVDDGPLPRRSPAWRRGVVREWPACVKTIVDVASRRRPVLDPPDDAVDRAVRSFTRADG